MGQQVVLSAMMQCTFGAAPMPLVVPEPTVLSSSLPAANIMDNKPVVNIPPFAMCSSPANPTVAAATSAAMGVLTPMPCVPAIAAPWVPGNPKALVRGCPALTSESTCMCNWGGVISIKFAGQTTHMTG